VHQVGGAEQTDARCRYVVGLKLDGAEHSSGVLERPGDMSVSGDPHSVRESSQAGAFRSWLDLSNEVGPARRDKKARSRIPDDSFLGLLAPDALEEVGGVLSRVTKPTLNPIWNAGELVDRQAGDVRGAVAEQRRTLPAGVVVAVAKAATASRLTGLSISEIGSGSTEHGLGATAVNPKFQDGGLVSMTGRAVALRPTSLGLVDNGAGLANCSFGTLKGGSEVRNGGAFSLVRTSSTIVAGEADSDGGGGVAVASSTTFVAGEADVPVPH
jgi:hypothetical protein